MKIVVSQSMYFPWVGLLEQAKLADVFVHYDDVQFARGFYNRVQVKTSSGVRWLTVPLRGQKRGQLINEVAIDNEKPWRENHREILRQAYLNAPYLEEMLSLVDSVFSADVQTLGDLSKASILALARYFSLDVGTKFLDSTELDVPGSSSQRLRDIVATLSGSVYITGHGARNYLDHGLFDESGIEVEYMNYQCLPYPQLHGEFTPYVTGLDLVANCGVGGVDYMKSESVSWKEFIRDDHE